MAAQAVVMTTTLAHTGLAKDEFEVHVGVYLADQDDVDGLAKPAASILSRRTGGEFANPDLADGIALLMAFAAYIAKQLGKLRHASQLKAAVAAGGTLDEHQDEEQAA